jgi:hypothetical protein
MEEAMSSTRKTGEGGEREREEEEGRGKDEEGKGKEEIFKNDWLQRGESFTIKGRLKYVVKYKANTVPAPTALVERRIVTSVDRFDRPKHSRICLWKAVEIDFTYGRNKDDGGRQFRPLLRVVEKPFGSFEVCAKGDARRFVVPGYPELPRAGPKDMVLVLDTLDQFVGGKMHEYCARALVTVRNAGHRNKANAFFSKYVNVTHRGLDVETRIQVPFRYGEYVHFENPVLDDLGGYETEKARYREMLRRLDKRISNIAKETLRKDREDGEDGKDEKEDSKKK